MTDWRTSRYIEDRDYPVLPVTLFHLLLPRSPNQARLWWIPYIPGLICLHFLLFYTFNPPVNEVNSRVDVLATEPRTLCPNW